MIVTLNRKQRISVGSRIRFHHCGDSGQTHDVELDERQFLNLDDAILNLDKYRSVRYFPLGGNLWLYRKDSITKIIDNYKHTFFWFYQKAWHYYIEHVHASIYDFMCHGKPFNHQSYAKYEKRLHHSFGRSASHVSGRYKTLSRSARNAHYEDDERTQRANVSRWKGADSRTRVRCRSGKYASRIRCEIKADQQDATTSSDETDNIQSSDQCSVEECDLSPENRLD